MPKITPTQLGEWFDAYNRVMTLYATQWVGPVEAEDVIQDVFLRLVSREPNLDHIQAWLFRAVKNACLNRIRSRNRRRPREERAFSSETDWFEPQTGDAIDTKLVKELLMNLPHDQREIVILKTWANLTLQQIATLNGVSATTVHRCYQRAINTMRQQVESPCPSSAQSLNAKGPNK